MSNEAFENVINQLLKLPPDQQTKTAIQTIKEVCKNDLFIFAKYLLNYRDITWRTHGDVVRCLESLSKRKIIVMPRNTFKSSFACVAYPIWRLIKDPDETILLDSELYKNSKNFLREIKQHLEAPIMSMIFGDFKSKTWGEGELIIKQRKKPQPQASITIGGIETVKTGQHFSICISDDLNSQKNSDTPEKREKVIDHFKYNLNILKPGGEYVVIGTRYAERDVIGFILGEVLKEKELSEGKL